MTWPYIYSAGIWLPVFTLFLLIAVSVSSWRGRSVPGALPVAFVSPFTARRAFGSLTEFAAIDPSARITRMKFQTSPQLLATTLITCFRPEFIWSRRWLASRHLQRLFMVPLLYEVAIPIRERYHLEGLGFGFDGSVLPPYVQSNRLFLTYIYGGLVHRLACGWSLVHSPRHRWPVVLMAIGQIAAGMIFLLEGDQILAPTC